ncbi:hypothetical protein HDU67_003949 [Dinochytrium kinnereticum]|nr:hypothetical protein HDU67_003949 [Dinochytrium kinnereticum]
MLIVTLIQPLAVSEAFTQINLRQTPGAGYDEPMLKRFLSHLSLKKEIIASDDGRNPNQFRIVTYNVWFDGLAQKQRANGLLELLKSEFPDVVCLQEVTRTFMEVLTSSTWWKNNYEICQKGFNPSQCWYGIITLVQKSSFELIAEEQIRIAQSHFESMANSEIRREQRKIAADRAKLGFEGAHQAGFICGDTNCHGEDEQNAFEEVRFADVWKVVKGDEPGPTFGLTFKVKDPQSRIDRIGWQGPIFRPIEVRRIGMEEVPGFEGLYPSDHVGLLSVFEMIQDERKDGA